MSISSRFPDTVKPATLRHADLFRRRPSLLLRRITRLWLWIDNLPVLDLGTPVQVDLAACHEETPNPYSPSELTS